MPSFFNVFLLTRSFKCSIIFFVFITLFFSPSTASPNINSKVLPLIQKKNALSQSLDSLDLIKQSKKREGLSFSEIELKQKQILDSLQIIRKIIQADMEIPPRLSDHKNGFPFLRFLCLSDLVKIIIAVSLLFTGILLLFRMVKNALFRVPKKNLISNKPADLGNLPSKPAKKLLPGELLDSIDNIKAPEAKKDHINFEYNEKKTDHHDDKDDDELEASIINAAAEGMSIQEISRHFHLSSDHITLILKLAESRKK